VPNLKCKVNFINTINGDIEKLCEEIINSITSKSHIRIIDALNAVADLTTFEGLYKTNTKKLEELLDVLTQLIKWRRVEGLVSSLNLTTTTLKEHPALFSEKLFKNIITGLHYLIKESHPIYTNIKADINERISIRKSTANLAFQLYKIYSDRSEKIPQTIIEWKNICSDNNEFAEVKNSWKDY